MVSSNETLKLQEMSTSSKFAVWEISGELVDKDSVAVVWQFCVSGNTSKHKLDGIKQMSQLLERGQQLILTVF